MTMEADAVAAARAYFEAWNHRDPEASIATFAPGGTYSDPSAGDGLTGPAIAAYAQGLFAAFPDLTFTPGELRLTADGTVVAEWLMRGINTGSLRGAPPTGAAVALPGVDLITVRDGCLTSVRGFFDRQAVPEQLGLQLVVQPQRVGPVTFGTSTRLEGPGSRLPGAMSLTLIVTRSDDSDEETLRVRDATRAMLPEIAAMSGFQGMTTVTVGRRMYPMTAWDGADDPHQLRHGGARVGDARGVRGSAGERGIDGDLDARAPRGPSPLRRVRPMAAYAGGREQLPLRGGAAGPARALVNGAGGQRGSAGSPAVDGRAAGEAAYRDAT